jgi:SecD/SecF fusion protein
MQQVSGASSSGTEARRRGSRAAVWRAVIALLVVGGALAVALTTPVRLGLDLRGGTQIVLETRDTGTVVADAESTDRVAEVLRKRVDALGIAEPTLARAGEKRIIVELPGVQDPREAAEVIGRTAVLSFHPVQGVAASAPPGPARTDGAVPEAGSILADESGQPLRLGAAALTGDLVATADAGADPQRGASWFVTVDFAGEGAARWTQLTADAACAAVGDPTRRVAIVLDGAVISSPQVDPSVLCGVGIVGGSTQITGQFTVDEVKDLAALIRGGSLPLTVEVVEQRTVGPTPGAEAIAVGPRGPLIGLLLTAVFITVVYRLLGLLAAIALACYALIAFAVLVVLGATLTLPGLAGFVLAIGLAIDANVLVFERAREEYAARAPGRGSAQDESARLQGSLRAGFSHAWSAILDSNVTTLIAAGLLFALASGPVRGFGVTLGIGVLASMVSALVIARAMSEWALRSRFAASHPGLTGIARTGRVRAWLADHGPDLMRRSRTWLAISGAVVVLSLTGILARGLDLGVEFTGGRLLEYSTSSPVDVDSARQVLAEQGFPRAVVQTSQADDGLERITVRTDPISNDEAQAVQDALAAEGGQVTKLRDELIGPTLGDELRTKALIALGIAFAAHRLPGGAVQVDPWRRAVVDVYASPSSSGCCLARKPIDGVFLAAVLAVVAERERHGGGVRPGARAAACRSAQPLRSGRQRCCAADDPAHDQHRARSDGHPRRTRAARR